MSRLLQTARHCAGAGVLLLALAAHGQALSTAGGPGSYVAVGGGVSAFQQDYGHNYIGGGAVFVDVNLTWRYGLEGEARWMNYHSEEQVSEANYVGGVRAQLWKPGSRLQPYGKFLAGVGHINFPFGY